MVIKHTNTSTIDFEQQFFHSPDTYVHPTAIVGSNVTLDAGVKIGPYCIVLGNTHIGAHTRLSANVVIGFEAQHTHTSQNWGSIHIGAHCNIREFATISGPKNADGATRIGDHCYIMNYAHIAHDVTLEHNVIITNQTQLAGHVYVEKYAVLMASVALHQFCRIGQYTCIAPYSGSRQDLPPFCMFTGAPTKFSGLNKVGLRRAGFSNESIGHLGHVAKLFYNDKLLLKQIMLLAHDDAQAWSRDPLVELFLTFIEKSVRGVSKRTVHSKSESHE